MFKGFVIGIVAAVVLAGLGGFFVVQSGLIPANADATPGWLETWAAGTSLDATIDREAPKQDNPVALTDANLLAGVDLYREHCAICHGTSAGEDSASPVAKGLYPQPPQLAAEGVEDDEEGASFWRIKHGIRWTGMPAWGRDAQRRADLDARAIPEAHGQASPGCAGRLAKGFELTCFNRV